MLNNVPAQVAKASRIVTMRHPNAMDCIVARKEVLREADSEPEALGGMPTIGGMGVLSSEDEADYEYEDLGEARIMFSGPFQTDGSNVTDDGDRLNYNDLPVEASIEPMAEPGTPEHFELKKHDLVTVMPGAGIALTYEVVGLTGSLAIPPYVRRAVLNPRQDLSHGI